MSPSKFFCYFCLSFLGGIFISSFNNSNILIFSLLFLGISYVFLFFKTDKALILGFCLITAAFGIFYYKTIDLKIEKSVFYLDSQKVNFVAIVVEEPKIIENKAEIILKIENLSGAKGKVLAKVNGNFQYGDRVAVSGVLTEPPVFKRFNYKNFLKSKGVYYLIKNPEIELLSKNSGNKIYSKILNLKNKLREIINSNLKEPENSLLAAIILGDKEKIPDDFKEKLNKTGSRHITCVSGMHISILTLILMSILIGFGFSRSKSFYLTIIFILFYIFLIGFQSSAIRAVIMGSLYLFAQKIGRASESKRALVFTAFLMVLFNPYLLRFDVGFQLSFLAVLSIGLFSPFFERIFYFLPNVFNLRNIFSMTLAAQILTIPILLYSFSSFSFVGPVTNILIIPLLPYIMFLGLFFAFLGIFSPILAQILFSSVYLLLAYIVKIINLFS